MWPDFNVNTSSPEAPKMMSDPKNSSLTASHLFALTDGWYALMFWSILCWFKNKNRSSWSYALTVATPLNVSWKWAKIGDLDTESSLLSSLDVARAPDTQSKVDSKILPWRWVVSLLGVDIGPVLQPNVSGSGQDHRHNNASQQNNNVLDTTCFGISTVNRRLDLTLFVFLFSSGNNLVFSFNSGSKVFQNGFFQLLVGQLLDFFIQFAGLGSRVVGGLFIDNSLGNVFFFLLLTGVVDHGIVGSKNTALGAQKTFWTKNVVDQVFSNVLVNSTQNIVQQVQVSTGINGSGKRQTSFLATRQTDTLFSDLGGVSVWKNVQVMGQSTCLDGLVVKLGIKLATKQNVFLDGSVHNPGNLRNICHRSVHSDRTSWFVQISKVGDVRQSQLVWFFGPKEVCVVDLDDLLADLGDCWASIDGEVVQLVALQEVGNSSDCNLGLDNVSNSPWQDSQREAKQVEQGQSREHDVCAQWHSFVRDDEQGKSRGTHKERSTVEDEVTACLEHTDLLQVLELLVVSHVHELLSVGVFPSVEFQRLDVVEDLGNKTCSGIFDFHLGLLEFLLLTEHPSVQRNRNSEEENTQPHGVTKQIVQGNQTQDDLQWTGPDDV
ncbi:hypothetical protein OGAPHI_003792 [Ogataea philodendri]|uniref:Uncharacterized protein n=1 Tax=Ogataea philodendri TaxID=1378263 RepID=A0A9P8P601_9ASCO|nr:uncharacterized protein OGAPHI_003792 [Ogataea philodendri]KAH3665604.1 hypothetical protein OGAPHI_003792 [Ogataea philodendri]